MNIYDLSRNFFNFSFENTEKIKPHHVALYFFAIEHCNRLGWKQNFGLPTTMVMEAIGIKSYNTYANTLADLVSFGFIKLIEKSKNQYSSNIIALSFKDKAHNKALDKALIKHSTKQGTKQSESTVQSIDSIDIPINNSTSLQDTNSQINNVSTENPQTSTEVLPLTNLEESILPVIIEKENTLPQVPAKKSKSQKPVVPVPAFHEFCEYAWQHDNQITEQALKLKYESWIENNWHTGTGKPIKNWKSTLLNTIPFLGKKEKAQKGKVEKLYDALQESLKMDTFSFSQAIKPNTNELHD